MLAPRRINDHDSFPRIFSPLTPTSPEEDGMMNRTRHINKMHMLNHVVRFRTKAVSFYNI